jgi:hypothetical protein
MAVLSFGGGVAFWFNFRKLDKEDLKLNEIQEGHAKRAQVTDETKA